MNVDLVCYEALRRNGCGLIEPQELARNCQGAVSEAGVHACLIRLARQGELLAFRSAWGDPAYLIPYSEAGKWHARLFPVMESEASTVPPQLMSVLARGLLLMCAAIRRNGLKRTRDGRLRKADERAVGKPLEDVLPGKSLEELLELLVAAGWVEEDVVQMSVNVLDEPIRYWLARPADEREGTLFEIWKRQYWPAEPWKQNVLWALERLDRGQRVSRDPWRKWLNPWPDATEQELEQEQFLEFLEAWGWIRRDDEHRFTILLPLKSEATFAEMPWIVQANREVLLSPYAYVSGLWELLQIATVRSSDPVWVLLIEQEHWISACAQHYSAEYFLNLLAERSVSALPEPLLTALGDWLSESGETTAPHAEDSSMPDRRGHPASTASLSVDPPPIVQLALHGWERDKAPITQISELYPGLREIPSVWLNECRAYHSATCRQIISTALHAGAELRWVEMSGPVRGVPRRLDCREDVWIVSADGDDGPKEIKLDTIERLQLILPGIND